MITGYANMPELKPSYPLFESGREIAHYLLTRMKDYPTNVLSCSTVSALYELATSVKEKSFIFFAPAEQFHLDGPYLSVSVGEKEGVFASDTLEDLSRIPFDPAEKTDFEPGDYYRFAYWDGKSDAEQLDWVPWFVQDYTDGNWLTWRKNQAKMFELVSVRGQPAVAYSHFNERAMFFEQLHWVPDNGDPLELEIGEQGTYQLLDLVSLEPVPYVIKRFA